jgi:hypothetical protein
VSVPSTEARPPAGKAAGGKKILGMPPPVAYLGLLVSAGGIAFFLWKRHQAAAAGTSTASAGTTTSAATGTNAAGEISTLQTELGDLQGEVAGAGTTTSKTSTTTGTGTATAKTGTTTGTPAHTVATASGTQSLNKLAAAHGSSGPVALTFTAQYKPHKSAEETKYIHAGNAQARLPAGTVWWIPKKAA